MSRAVPNSRKARLRKTKAKLIDELEALESRLAPLNNPESSPEETAATEQRYRSIFELGPAGVLLLSLDGTVVDANRAFARMLGYSPDELRGVPWQSFAHPNHVPETERIDKLLLSGEMDVHITEKNYLHKDGHIVTARMMSFAYRNADGAPLNIICQAIDVTDRVAAETALQESEARLRAIMDHTPLEIFLKDADGRYLTINRRFEELWGVKNDDVRGALPADVHDPKLAEASRSHDMAVLEQKQVISQIDEVAFEDGKHFFRAIKFPIRSDDGTVTGIGAISRDITDEIIAESKLHESEAELRKNRDELETRVADRTKELHDADTRLRQALDAMSDGFILIDKDDKIILMNARYRELSAGIGQGPEVGMLFEDFLHASIESGIESAQGADIESYIKNRLEQHRNPGGPYEILHANGRWLRLEDKLTPDGGIIGIRTDITERKRAEEALKESETRLFDAIESIPDGFVYFDANERMVFCNQKYRDYYPLVADLMVPGVRLEDLARAAANLGQMVPSQTDVETHVRERLAHFRVGREGYEQNLNDGRWLLCSESRTSDGGIVGVRTDITKRKQAEEARLEAETRFRAVFNGSSAGITLKDVDGRYLLVNESFAKSVGMKPEDFAGRSAHDIFPGECSNTVEIEDRHVLQTGEVSTVERQGKSLDHRNRNLLVQKAPIKSPAGEVTAIVTTLSDITDLKRAEAALQESERQRRMTMDNIDSLVIQLDLEARYLFINKTCEKWYARPASEIVGKTLYDIHGEDLKDRFGERFARIAKGETITFEETLNYPDGVTRSVQSTHTPDFDEQGVVRGSFAVTTDITEHKQAEEARLESESRFRAVFNGSSSGISVKSSDGHYLLVNKSFAKAFNKGPEDIVGLSTGDLYPQRLSTQIERHDRQVIETGEAAVFETMDEFPNIGYRNILVQKTPIAGTDGEIVAVVAIVTDITKMKQAEIALHDSEHQRRIAMDNVDSLIIHLDMEGRYLSVNKACEKWYARPANEIIGKIASDIMGHARKKGFENRLAKAHRGENVTYDDVVTYPDGVTRHIHGIHSPDIDDDGKVRGSFAIITDITERIQAEAQFRAIVDNSPAAVSVKDAKGRFTLVNSTYAMWTKMNADEIIGLTLEDLYPLDEIRHVTAYDQQVFKTGETMFVEAMRTFNDGRKRQILSQKCPIRNAAGEVAAVATILTDITELKQAESQLIQSDKLATLGRMAAGITHELAQPLNNIRLVAQSALMDAAEEEAAAETHDSLKTIDLQIARMAEIIDHMRVFARKDDSLAEAFTPSTCIKRALALMDLQVSNAGIRIEENISLGRDLVLGSTIQLEQVMINLLSNARDAIVERQQSDAATQTATEETFEGVISVSATDDRDAEMITVTVADNGGGFSEEIQQNLFDPFFTTKDVGEGTGLGLSVSYTIIQSMGGTIDATSNDSGTYFTISLPSAGETPAVKPTSVAKTLPLADNETRVVLLVEDEATASGFLSSFLIKQRYRVLTASNGAEALALFESEKIDAVITDLQMPVMDGGSLITSLHKQSPDLPIIVTTGKMSVGHEKDPSADGVSHVFRKPIDLRALVDKLAELVR